VNVTFDNLITGVSFSEEYFEPSQGQTQQVAATFAANVNWTLQVLNAASNTVRTVTGSGSSMHYNWNGTGEGNTNLPAGIYKYLISASTNGLPPEPPFSGGGTNDPPPEPGSSSASSSTSDSSGDGWYPKTRKQVIDAGWSSFFIDFPPLPPYSSNGVWCFPDPLPPLELPVARKAIPPPRLPHLVPEEAMTFMLWMLRLHQSDHPNARTNPAF